MSQNTSRQIRTAKFSYIRSQRRPNSENQRRSIAPSVVHLSSIIQSAKKVEVNKELMHFTQRNFQFNEKDEPLNPSPNPKGQEHNNLLHFYKLEKQAGQRLKKKKIFNDQVFLSEIADDELSALPTKEDYKRLQQQTLFRQKRRAYIMRNLEFKNFLQIQETNRTAPKEPIQQIKQIQYQNQKIKSKSFKFNIRNFSYDNIKLRKNGQKGYNSNARHLNIKN